MLGNPIWLRNAGGTQFDTRAKMEELPLPVRNERGEGRGEGWFSWKRISHLLSPALSSFGGGEGVGPVQSLVRAFSCAPSVEILTTDSAMPDR